MVNDILGVLGREQSDPEVVRLIRGLELDEIGDAPPDRRYIGSRSRGIDLMIVRDHVATVQIYMKAMQGFSAYSGPLLFGIAADMNQDEIHGLLGVPVRYDKSHSSYAMVESGVKLVLEFDAVSKIKLLSASILQGV
ncbi:hypothetical protein [Ralstonia sp. 24A2]|uniref:hypothetical protein n=1 Tax=Ralstonia sp. 24A2 TaxID=3447364 RepID=UPI003F69CD71